jgi:hypothetical protein
MKRLERPDETEQALMVPQNKVTGLYGPPSRDYDMPGATEGEVAENRALVPPNLYGAANAQNRLANSADALKQFRLEQLDKRLNPLSEKEEVVDPRELEQGLKQQVAKDQSWRNAIKRQEPDIYKKLFSLIMNRGMEI